MTCLLSSARRGRRGLGRATAGRRGVVEDLTYGADDRGAADAVALEQLPWRAAPRDLAHGQAVDDDAGVGQRLRHRRAEAALGVVVFHGQERAAGRARRLEECRAIEGLEAIEVDDTEGNALRGQLVRRGQRLVQGDPGGDDGEAVALAGAHDLRAADGERLVGGIERIGLHARRADVDEAVVGGGELHAGVGGRPVARVEDDGVGHGPEEREILEGHLRGAVLADADAGMRAAELHVAARDAGHPDLVGRAREEARERRREGDEALGGQAGGDAHHVLLGDEALDVPLRIGFQEALGVRRVLHVAVEHHDAGIGGAEAHQRLAVGLARRDGARGDIRTGPGAGHRGGLAPTGARSLDRRRRHVMEP